MTKIWIISFIFLHGVTFMASQDVATTDSGITCPATTCVSITECPEMLEILEQVKRGEKGAFAELTSKQCGFDGATPRVCCPREDSGAIENKSEGSFIITTTEEKEESTTLETSSSSEIEDQQATQPFTTPSTRIIEEDPTESNHNKDFAAAIGVRNGLEDSSCGKRSDLLVRITFGDTASEGQYPWAVSLKYKRRSNGHSLQLCGGTLVSSIHVITAAHCLDPENPYQIHSAVMGTVNRNDKQAVEVNVANFVVHPDYTSSPVAINDIGLIKLERPVQFTDYIQPICLGTERAELSELITVAGWGRTERRRSSANLQYTDIFLVEKDKCNEEYESAVKRGRLGSISSLVINDNQLCGRGDDGSDSCSGDSGGPLMAQDENEKFYLLGVVSFGTNRCDSSLPGVYTRVSAYVSWIKATLAVM